MVTIAVPDDRAFEAAAIEEYLIRELNPPRNRVGTPVVPSLLKSKTEIMNVLLDSALESRLTEIARQRAVPFDELIRQVLADYVQRTADDPAHWVHTTQSNLAHVWPNEDFTEWGPPDAAQ